MSRTKPRLRTLGAIAVRSAHRLRSNAPNRRPREPRHAAPPLSVGPTRRLRDGRVNTKGHVERSAGASGEDVIVASTKRFFASRWLTSGRDGLYYRLSRSRRDCDGGLDP